MEKQEKNASSDNSVSAAAKEELLQQKSSLEIEAEDFIYAMSQPSFLAYEEDDEFREDFEDSWASDSTEDYSTSTEEELSEEYDEKDWVDIKHMIIENRSASADSSWEVVSMKSADDVSLCSVNDLAKTVIEEFEMNCKVAENILNSTSEKKEVISPMNVVDAVTIQCGLILFRKEGTEVACVTKANALMNPGEALTIPVVSPLEGESPLEAAVRGFVKRTNCHNLDACSILNKVLQIPKGNTLLLLFPALISSHSRELNFGPSENIFSWNNTYDIANQSRKSVQNQNLSNVIHAAYQLLLRHHDELPQLVDDDIAELLVIASYQLFEYIKKENKSITIHEVKNFFRSNHDDLEKILHDCSEMEKAAMVRKLVRQLPINVPENKIPILDHYGVEYHHITPLEQLEQILLTNFNDNGLNWKHVELDLATCPCIQDEIIRDILGQAGWIVSKRRFKFTSGTATFNLEARINAQKILFTAISNLRAATQATFF